MKMYILFNYESMLYGHSIAGVWFDKENAKNYQRKYGGIKIEEVKLMDKYDLKKYKDPAEKNIENDMNLDDVYSIIENYVKGDSLVEKSWDMIKDYISLLEHEISERPFK